MDNKLKEKILKKVVDIEEKNEFIMYIKKNKQIFLDLNDDEIYNYLGKMIIDRFNDRLTNKLNLWLDTLDDNYDIINLLKNEYLPFIEKLRSIINTQNYNDLKKLAIVLDNVLFFLDRNYKLGNYQKLYYKLLDLNETIKEKLIEIGLVNEIEFILKDLKLISRSEYELTIKDWLVNDKYEIRYFKKGFDRLGNINENFGSLLPSYKDKEGRDKKEWQEKVPKKRSISTYRRQH